MTQQQLIRLATLTTALVIGGLVASSKLRSPEVREVSVLCIGSASSVDKKLTPYGLTSAYLSQRLRDELGEDWSVRLEPVQGSIDTLLSLESSSQEDSSVARIGVAQADVLYHYLNGGHASLPDAHPRSSVRAVARLFQEWLFVYGLDVTPASSGESAAASAAHPGLARGSVRELLGSEFALQEDIAPAVYGGTPGSGHRVTAQNIVQLLQLGTRLLTANVPAMSSSSPVGRGVVWTTVSPPSSRVSPQQALASDKIRPSAELILFDDTSVQMVTNALGGRTYSSVPAERALQGWLRLRPVAIERRRAVEDYPRDLIESRSTVGVDAILVASHNTPAAVIAVIERVLLDLETGEHRVDESHLEPVSARIADGQLVAGASNGRGTRRAVEIDPGHLLTQTSIVPPALTAGPDQPAPDRASVWRRRTDRLPVASHAEVRIWRLGSFWRALTRLEVPLILLLLPALVVALLRILPSDAPMARLREWVDRAWERRRRTALLVLTFLAVHFAAGTLIWVAEYQTETLRPESELAVRGGLFATWHLFRHLLIGEFQYELLSPYSVVLIGGLKGGYALASIWLTVTVAEPLKEWSMRSKESETVLVVGWTNRLCAVLCELSKQDQRCVVLTHRPPPDKSGPDPAPQIPEFAQSSYGLASVAEAFKPTAYAEAKSVIVLADVAWAKRDGTSDVDFWVTKSVRSVDRWRRNGGPSTLRLVAEVVHRHNIEEVKASGADEVICIEEFGVELLAHEAAVGAVAEVYRELLRTDSDSNEIYLRDASEFGHPADFPMPFCEVVSRSGALFSEGMDQRIPIGISRVTAEGTKTEVNPVGDDASVRFDDRILVISRQRKARRD